MLVYLQTQSPKVKCKATISRKIGVHKKNFTHLSKTLLNLNQIHGYNRLI